MSEDIDTVMAERAQLINLAYRLLGSLADAEDVVQETYARWYALRPEQRASIAAPGGWLTRVASRICLDLLGSARVRRERYVGEWVPEPVPDHDEWGSDPADRITLDESISMAFLVVLESMTPAERVTFVLHDVFRYPFAEVAAIVGRTPAACRQLAVSGRRRIDAARPAATPAGRQADIVRAFKQAWEAKDISALVALLDAEAIATADGGGRANAVLRPIIGAEPIARYLTGFTPAGPRPTIVERTVNGFPGLIVEIDHTPVTVLAFDIAGDRIRQVWAVRNPDKLRQWTS
ncbi:RNA polymerase sigma factor SigJ [Nocardia sp. NPDC048505]|uniref:RNA polymerase sigma factor SigJ n=1 Tax=unclassified Nocardia TaxID=2637762 RepID=UPI0033DC312C